jgi:hypothetical protein
MKYVSFAWPPVVARQDSKRLARAMPNSGSYFLEKNYFCTQDSVRSIKSYHSVGTVQKTIFDQNCFCCDNQ